MPSSKKYLKFCLKIVYNDFMNNDEKDKKTINDILDNEIPTIPDNKEHQHRPTPEVQLRKDPLIGQCVAEKYFIHQKIGTGGMGAVYKAKQKGMDRWIALKVMLKEYAYNEKILKRFELEAYAASRLNHPNTIRIYDFGKTKDDTLYIAMEYLDGVSLARIIKNEDLLAVERTLKIGGSVCKSLMEAHDKGVIHRDLKPDNIFLCEVGGEKDFVKVLDFGLAKLREADKSFGTLTQAGTIFGTPKYMAPEQCKSVATVDHRADIYSLGVVLYECLAGSPPFEAENPLGILIKHVQEMPPPFKIKRPDLDIPQRVEEIVMKSLKKDPSQRFQSAGEMLAEIERVKASLEGKFSRVVYFKGQRPCEISVERSEAETVLDTKHEIIEEKKKIKKISPARVFLYVTGIIFVLLIIAGGTLYYILPQPLPPQYKKIVPNKVVISPPSSEMIESVDITINTDPAGASIFSGGKLLGVSPLKLTALKENRKEEVKIALEGYSEEKIQVDFLSSRFFALKLEKLVKEEKKGVYVKFNKKDEKKSPSVVEPEKKIPASPPKPDFEKVDDIKKTPYK